MNSLSTELQVLHQPLRQHHEELANRLQIAELLLARGRAALAREALFALLQAAERFTSEWGVAENPFWQRIFATERANLLWRLSVPNLVLERYAEAEQNLQYARWLIGDEPSALLVNILYTQGEVYRSQEKFERAAEYIQSAAYMAVRQEVRQYEAAVKCYESLGKCFLSNDEREKCLGASAGQASDLAFSHGHYAEAARRELLNFRLRIMSDPTGRAIEEFAEERTKPTRLKLRGRRMLIRSGPAGQVIEEFDQAKLGRIDDTGYQAELALVTALFWITQGEAESAKDALDRALDLAQSDVAARFQALSDLAEYHAFGLLRAFGLLQGDPTGLLGWQPDFPRAIEFAEQARVLATNFAPAHPQLRDTIQRLIRIRLATGDPEQRRLADRELDELRQRPGISLVHALLARAQVNYAGENFAKSRQLAEEAEQYPAPPDLRRLVLTAKMHALIGLERFDEALEASRQAIELLRPLVERKIYSASRGAPSYVWMLAWRDRVEALAILYDTAAALSVRADRLDTAFDFAEAGRCQLLRQQLTDGGAELAGPAAFDEIRAIAQRERAALVMFSVGPDRTLALRIHPDRPQPSKVFVDITGQRLQELLPAEQGQAWNAAVPTVLPELSKKFLTALEDAIGGCDVAYILAPTQLSRIPFAALSFSDGSPLVSRCAIASAPSATVLKLLLSCPKAMGGRTCLAVGVGSEAQYRFADQAEAIRALEGWGSCDDLGPAPSKEAWLKAAPRYSTLFLACHGRIDPATYDGLAASRLALANGEYLTARDVFFELNGRLEADLVFLNACASGRFQSRLDSETSGFGAAFLRAGARSVITAAGYIDPAVAQELAVEFFRLWLGGAMSKAAALQEAQLRMQKYAGASPASWGSYMLIGDYR